MITPETSRSTFRRWYENHREEFNEKRRQAYAKTPVRKAVSRERAEKYRAARRQGLSIERSLTRLVDGQPVRVFTTGELADLLGCSAQMIRNWEAKGWIPTTLFPDSHRLYMKHQVMLITSLYNRLSAATGKTRVAKAHIVSDWKNSIAGLW